MTFANTCDFCKHRNECEYFDVSSGDCEVEFCDGCRYDCECEVQTVSCKVGRDIQCNNGYEIAPEFDDDDETEIMRYE